MNCIQCGEAITKNSEGWWHPGLSDHWAAPDWLVEATRLELELGQTKAILDRVMEERNHFRRMVDEVSGPGPLVIALAIDALEHCRNRPHEHNPPSDFVMTQCEVIDRALAALRGDG